MKYSIYTFIFLLLGVTSTSQNIYFDWAVSFGSNYNDRAIKTAIDKEGNVITVTQTDGLQFTHSQAPGEILHDFIPYIYSNIILQKHTSNGELIISKFFTYPQGLNITNSGLYVNQITTDSDGNMYLAGTISTGCFDADLNLGEYPICREESSGRLLFIIKYSPEGEFIWERHLEGRGTFRNLEMEHTSNGESLIATGVYDSDVPFNLSFKGDSANYTQPTDELNQDIRGLFAIRLNKNGYALDNTYFSNLGSWHGHWQSHVRKNGHILIAGISYRPIPGITEPDFSLAENETLFFLFELDQDFNIKWSHYIPTQDSAFRFSDIAEDGYNNILITGTYYSDDFTADPDTPPLGTYGLGRQLGYVLKFTPTGKFIQQRRFGDELYLYEPKITTLPDNRVCIVGYKNPDLDAVLDGVFDLFGFIMEEDGTFGDYFKIEGNYICRPEEILSDKYGNIYIFGAFAYFINTELSSDLMPLGSFGGEDIFLIKYKVPANYVSSIENIQIFPNPTKDQVHFVYNGNTPIEASLFNMTGIKVREWNSLYSSESISIANLPAGTYVLHLKKRNETHSFKIIKQ